VGDNSLVCKSRREELRNHIITMALRTFISAIQKGLFQLALSRSTATRELKKHEGWTKEEQGSLRRIGILFLIISSSFTSGLCEGKGNSVLRKSMELPERRVFFTRMESGANAMIWTEWNGMG